jgi:hypothetical protein
VKDDCAMYDELYHAVMGVLGLIKEALMYALSYMCWIISPKVLASLR